MQVMTLAYVLIILFETHLLQTTDGHQCEYQIPKVHEIVTGIESVPLPDHLKVKRDASSNIRISFYFMSDFSSNAQASLITAQILEPARQQLQQAVMVRYPFNGLLLVNRSCSGGVYRRNENGVIGCANGCSSTVTCLNFQVPDIYLKQCVTIDANGNVTYSGQAGQGATNTDLVLLVTNQNCSTGILAYASSCFFDTWDRPILGVINICTGLQANQKIKESIKVIKHEMIHALGFAVDKFAFYRYPNGVPIVPRNNFGFPNLGTVNDAFYMWSSNIIQTFSRSRQSVQGSYSLSFYSFVLPNVLTAARNIFNCPTLDGVDLENEGAIGTILTHFDEYVYGWELMTGITNYNLDTLSNLTLALLYDTGWYNVDFTKADYFSYGNGKGCIMPLQGCYKYMQSQGASGNIFPFCNVPFQTGKILGCSAAQDYYQFCPLIPISGLPSKNQYFTSLPGVSSSVVNLYGGTNLNAEYCPTLSVTFNPNTFCSDTTNQGLTSSMNVMASYYGSDSMCFNNDITGAFSSDYYGASCQQFVQNPDNSVSLIYGSQIFNCSLSTKFSVSLSSGRTATIYCPGISSGSISTSTRILVSISIALAIWFR